MLPFRRRVGMCALRGGPRRPVACPPRDGAPFGNGRPLRAELSVRCASPSSPGLQQRVRALARCVEVMGLCALEEMLTAVRLRQPLRCWAAPGLCAVERPRLRPGRKGGRGEAAPFLPEPHALLCACRSSSPFRPRGRSGHGDTAADRPHTGFSHTCVLLVSCVQVAVFSLHGCLSLSFPIDCSPTGQGVYGSGGTHTVWGRGRDRAQRQHC